MKRKQQNGEAKLAGAVAAAATTARASSLIDLWM